MFSEILIEENIQNLPYTQNILASFPDTPTKIIDKVENYWGKVKKPYLQKRDNLKLYLGKKVGQLIKEAPDAYGTAGEPHYYFIHAYNCIYECEYCFLQGYFHSPDIVLFVNHDDIISEIEQIIKEKPNAWFHAGEFSDSLALSHITDEWQAYFDFFQKHPEAKLELRTKAVNTKVIEKLTPLENVITTFSLSPDSVAKEYDRKTPPTKARLRAIERLAKQGHPIGIHLDPIMYSDQLESEYTVLISELARVLPDKLLKYISMGVVRYTKDVYRQVEKNYPTSTLTVQPYVKSFDQKVRYSRPMRNWILNKVKDIVEQSHFDSEKIYLCMEDHD